MDPEPFTDPRYRSSRPTPQERDAWAAREHKRREAWLAGPTEEEKQDWARRTRWRASLGLSESRLGPAAEEVNEWAARERKRREAWAAGPSEEEKREWARQFRRRALLRRSESPLPPTEDDIEAWARREGERRREWAAGPSEEEKEKWARREAGGILADLLPRPERESEFFDRAHELLREAELAGKGTFYSLLQAPGALWSHFVRAGRTFEEDIHQQPRRGRVRL